MTYMIIPIFRFPDSNQDSDTAATEPEHFSALTMRENPKM